MSDEKQNEEDISRFARARETSLILKWSRGGRLSETEFDEVKHRLPQTAKFDRAPEVDLSGRALYKKKLEEYCKTFGRSVRTLKSLIADGKAAEPPELPPFDQPELMLDWWTRHKKQRAPRTIVLLAEAGAGAEKNNEEGINVSELSAQMQDMVKQARDSLAAAWKQLSEAYASGIDSRIEIKQRRWIKAAKALKEAEQAAREDRKESGDLIPKAELLPEITTLLQTLEHMRSTRRRRTLTRIDFDLLFQRCNKNDKDGAQEIIGDAVDMERENENSVLRRLKQFRSLEEIDAFQLENNNAGD